MSGDRPDMAPPGHASEPEEWPHHPVQRVYWGDTLIVDHAATEDRMATLERLVLEITKHVSPHHPIPPGAVRAIEALRARHPDV